MRTLIINIFPGCEKFISIWDKKKNKWKAYPMERHGFSIKDHDDFVWVDPVDTKYQIVGA